LGSPIYPLTYKNYIEVLVTKVAPLPYGDTL